MDLEVRPARVDDRKAVRALRLDALTRHPKAFLETYDEAAARPLSDWSWPEDGDDALLVAARGASLLGMVMVKRDEAVKCAHRAWFFGVYVRTDARGQGVGDALMASAIDLARNMAGVRQVQLSVSAETPAARRLYERHGFRAWGREPDVLFIDGRYIDELHMVLPLDE